MAGIKAKWDVLEVVADEHKKGMYKIKKVDDGKFFFIYCFNLILKSILNPWGSYVGSISLKNNSILWVF